MKPAKLIVWAMVLTEIGTNLHVLFPPVFLGYEVVNGVSVERYRQDGIDPWTVRMVSLSLASAFMLFLFAWIRPDRRARNYIRAWGLYFVAQATQKMAGLNQAPEDWPFDVLIMGMFIVAADMVNRFGHPGIETNPNLRIVWIKPPE